MDQQTRESLRKSALELEAMMFAYEKTFLDDYGRRSEARAPEFARVAFDHIRAMAYDYMTMAYNAASEMNQSNDQTGLAQAASPASSSESAASKLFQSTDIDAYSNSKNPIDKSERYDGGYVQVLSCNKTAGSVRILNTEWGNLYSPIDILRVCGVKAPKKWSDRYLLDAAYNFTVYVALLKRKDYCGRISRSDINFVSQEDAGKIMRIIYCSPTRAKWLREKAFAYRFGKDDPKYPLSQLVTLNPNCNSIEDISKKLTQLSPQETKKLARELLLKKESENRGDASRKR